jgi:hypothetical protein
MKGTTTRASTDRRPGRGGHGYDTYTDGANALKIGYGSARSSAAPAQAPPRRPQRSAPPQRTPAPARQQAPLGEGLSAPAAPPLPLTLPRPSFLVFMVSTVVVGVLGVLVLNTKINENAFRLDALQAQQSALDMQEEQLTQALADRESTGNLRAAAIRLGLVPAGEPAFIKLPNGEVVGVPQPAVGGRSPASGAGR